MLGRTRERAWNTRKRKNRAYQKVGMVKMSKIVIIGAGKTGRGFLARLLKDNEIVFIDK